MTRLTLSALMALTSLSGGVGRAGGGPRPRRRQKLVQQVPGLSRHRRRRQEQGRPGTERARRPPFRHREGYSYSDANKNSGITWNEAQFKEYIKDPKAKIPGTKMAFAGIKSENEINNLWAYVSQFDKDGKVKSK